jgi:DNA-binding beta-propeller fold protein YncE
MKIPSVAFTLIALVTLWGISRTARAQIFVTNSGAGTISEYTTSGVPVNRTLVTGLTLPWGLAVSGGNLFVTDLTGGTIGEYTSLGAPVDRDLIRGLLGPRGVAASRGNLFVASDNPRSESSRVGKYTISGAPVNPALIQRDFFGFVEGVAVSRNKLFVADLNSDLVAEYTTSGALVNPTLIRGLSGPTGIAVSEGHLFVTNFRDGNDQRI